MRADHLHVFWVSFEASAPAGCGLGCGVTAFDEADARALIAKAFPDALSQIASLRADVVPAQLDQGHVIPNMGNLFVRGIWFPLGHAT